MKELKKRTQKQYQTEEENEYLTVQEVAHRLRVDDTTVRRWIKAGALKAVALPHRGKRQGYRIARTALDAVLNEQPTRKQAS